MISTRSAGLLIDTVVCLTLAKWETVSGRFGGYLMSSLASLNQEIIGLLPFLQRCNQPSGFNSTSRPSFARRASIFRRDFLTFERTLRLRCTTIQHPKLVSLFIHLSIKALGYVL